MEERIERILNGRLHQPVIAITLGALVTIVCFLLDVVIPRGATAAIGYCIVPVLAVGTRDQRILIFFTIVCIVLNWIAYFVEPVGWLSRMSIFDRLVVTIILTAAASIASLRLELLRAMLSQAQALTRAKHELEMANKDLAHFSFLVAHDLRAPLNTIGLQIQAVSRDRSNSISTASMELLDAAMKEIQSMGLRISLLLGYGRLGTKEIRLKECDTRALLESVCSSLKAQIEESKTRIEYGVLPKIIADATLISSLFQNLIENSIKYRAAEPPLIEISAKQLDTCWRFMVKDNGIGIAEKDVGRIFEPFTQLGPGKSLKSGVGLGLATCKRIVEKHGGSIAVTPNADHGVTFTFTISRSNSDSNPLSSLRNSQRREHEGTDFLGIGKIKLFWSELRSSLWFLPSIIIAAGIALAFLCVRFGSGAELQAAPESSRWFGAGPEGAREMLSTIASTMIAVVSVTFSMTLVTLAMASSQYTPRILRNFMRSRTTQVVLGAFAGIYCYCLVVLRTIRSGTHEYVPSIAVSVAFLLAVCGIGLLVYFIHHVASSIQASSIIGSAARETIRSIDLVFPESLCEPSPDQSLAGTVERKWHSILSRDTGYIKNIDIHRLIELATHREFVVRIERCVGEFVIEGGELAKVSHEIKGDDRLAATVLDAFTVSDHRTLDQDPGFGIRQLVDIALKALSSGINDTTTAVTCVHYLTAVLSRLAQREIPCSFRQENGEVRAIIKGPTFAGLLGLAFDQIRQNAPGNVTLLSSLAAALRTIRSFAKSPDRLSAIDEQIVRVEATAQETLGKEFDRMKV